MHTTTTLTDMKNILLLVALMAFAPLVGQSNKKTATKPYKIASVTKSESLKATECKIVFRIKKPVLPDDEYYFDVVADGNAMEITGNKNSFSIKLEAGKHSFHTYMMSSRYYPIDIDGITCKGGHVTTIDLWFKKTPEITEEKPVIYLYPTVATPVCIELETNSELTFTYPAYENGWLGIANPDGSFTKDGKTYPYLFWEGKSADLHHLSDYTTGFVVKGGETVAFLEAELTKMGLNQKEQTDFITFWAPRMITSKANFVQFVFNEDYDQIAELNIEPKPDQVFRVFMLWTPLESPTELPEPKAQEIPTLDRTGFCVVEWGGSEIPMVIP